MVWKELMTAIRKGGLDVTEAKVRWLIASGKVERPPLDGSLRFKFNGRHLAQLQAVLRGKPEVVEMQARIAATGQFVREGVHACDALATSSQP